MIKIGFFNKAEDWMQKSFDMYRRLRIHNPDYADISHVLHWRGVLSVQNGTLREGKSLFQKCLDIDVQLIGEYTGDDVLPPTLFWMAKVEMAENNVGKARKLLSECMVSCRRLLGEDADNGWIARALLELGRVRHVKYCKFDAAEFLRFTVIRFVPVDCSRTDSPSNDPKAMKQLLFVQGSKVIRRRFTRRRSHSQAYQFGRSRKASTTGSAHDSPPLPHEARATNA